MSTTGQPSSGPKPPAAAPAAPAPPALPPARATELSNRVKERFADVSVNYAKERRLKLTTTPEKMMEVALFVRDKLGFDHISCVSGTDYIAKSEIEVVYFVGSLSRPELKDFVIAVAERPRRENPVVSSLVEVWAGAEYHERETFEMLGVNFQGHPGLKHLLLPEDWNDLPPLRKDYNSPGR